MQDEASGLTSWSKVNDGNADVFTQHKVPIKGFLAELFKSGTDESADGESGGKVRQHLGSLYCVVVVGRKAIGILQVRGSRKGLFSDADEQLLRALSRYKFSKLSLLLSLLCESKYAAGC